MTEEQKVQENGEVVATVDTEQLEEVTEESVAQDEVSIDLMAMAQFKQLTKRNQQYMLTLDRNLSIANLSKTIRRDIYVEMCETLEEGQHTGQTARQLYGTPTECTNVILEQQFPSEQTAERSPDWQIAVDGALILGSVFTLITGFSLMRAGDNPGATVNTMGIITLIVNYIVAGLSMLVVSKVLPDMSAPRGNRGYVKYFSVSTLAMLVWIAAVGISSTVLPSTINPVFEYEFYFIVGAITFALRFYLKRKWKIRGGLF